MAPATVWDVRVGQFFVTEKRPPSTGVTTTPSHFDTVTGIRTDAPETFGERHYLRTTGKATLSRYRPRLLAADHEWKFGGSIEQGEHRHSTVIPTGVSFVDSSGRPFQSISRDPFPDGGQSITARFGAAQPLLG
jgi:hypothetical protein